MKLTLCLVSSLLLLGGSLFAQVPGMMTMQPASVPQGTDLGANNTVNAAGIALGNRVKLRGFVDFPYSYADMTTLGSDSRFSVSSDVDFLIDLSPVTAEVHLNMDSSNGVGLEQAFGRYSFNRDFNITFGRQLTSLGYESDEAPDMRTVSYAYFTDVLNSHPAFIELSDAIAAAYNTANSLLPGAAGYATGDMVFPNLRRNYQDGIRANFNNGRFGLSLGLHDGYWANSDFNDNVAVDIAASLMIVPGLEARLGYARQDTDLQDINQVNAWIEFQQSNLTLAFEYDYFDLDGNSDLWDIMLLGSYQFTNSFATTLRYSHEEAENYAYYTDYSTDRFTLAFLFSVTDNFGINVEYSHTEFDTNVGNADADELYVEGLLTF